MSLASLLGQHSGLVPEEIHGTGTPLHLAADWPGYSPAGPRATPGYSDQTAAQLAAEPGTQRENLITWLHDRRQ